MVGWVQRAPPLLTLRDLEKGARGGHAVHDSREAWESCRAAVAVCLSCGGQWSWKAVGGRFDPLGGTASRPGTEA